MALYEVGWRWFVGIVLAAGLLLELISQPLSLLMAMVGMSVGVAGCIALGTHVAEADGVLPASTPASRVFGYALLVALGIAAMVGIAAVSAAEMLAVSALVVVSSPLFLRMVGAVAAASVNPSAEGLDRELEAKPASPLMLPRYGAVDVERLTAGDVAAMDTADLVRDWRRSYLALQQATDPRTKIVLVQCRQAYLDELERRHPDGVHDWLESGARAAGDPTKFVARRRNQGADGSQAV